MNNEKDLKEKTVITKKCKKTHCFNRLRVFSSNEYCGDCFKYVEKLSEFAFHLREIFIQKFIEQDIDALREYYNKYANEEINDSAAWKQLIKRGWKGEFDSLFIDNEIKNRAEKIVVEYCIDWFNIEILDWNNFLVQFIN